MTDSHLKNLYFSEGIQYIPKLLELVDRNPLSSTFGCFDRSYWHYRTSDFPSGMYQEAVLPLALAVTLPHPENPYYGKERIYQIILGGIAFACRSAHRNGACDDYFPFERATGAAAFSLYACSEALLGLGEKGDEYWEPLKLWARYLAREGVRESGVLSNHKALIVLALYNIFLLTGEETFKHSAIRILKDLLSLQDPEGWFPEYGGCDPGYLTFTIDFLAKYYQKSGDPDVVEPLCRAIEFASYFMHPDGSYGGEYGSRNTFHFLPHGFEVMGAATPWAIPTANDFLRSLENKTRSYLEDDRIFIHYTYNYLQAYRDFFKLREDTTANESRHFQKFFERSGLLAVAEGADYAVISLKKGGVAKIFKKGALRLSDGGFVGLTAENEKFMSAHAVERKCERREDCLTVEGYCYEYRDLVFKPFSFFLFRGFQILIARFLPANFVRKLLQKKAITQKLKKLPIRFKKEFFLKGLTKVRYTLWLEAPSLKVKELWIGADPTFIYIATSQPFQGGNLLPWISLASQVQVLNQNRTVQFEQALA